MLLLMPYEAMAGGAEGLLVAVLHSAISYCRLAIGDSMRSQYMTAMPTKQRLSSSRACACQFCAMLPNFSELLLIL